MVTRKLKQKWHNKRINAKKEGISFSLTLEEFIQLLEDAGITEEEIGNTEYHLARYKDQGGYKIGNCRFITHIENRNEKIISEKSREASRQHMRNINANRSSEEKVRIAKLGGLSSAKSSLSILGKNKLKEEEIQRRLKLIKEANIDLTKYGWVQKVAKLLGVTHTHVKRFIDRYYNEPVYRRSLA